MFTGGFLLHEMVPKNTIIETKENVENYYKDYNFYQRVYNRIFHHVSNHYYESFFKCEDDIVPFLKKTDNCYLEGWWQYKDIAIPLVSMIQKEIIEIDKIQDKNIKETTNRIDECESVAIHVRRGDYLKYSKLFGNICTDEYYKAAIKYSFKRIKNPVFFVFTDDKDYCELLFGDSAIICPPVDAKKAYFDILLMSKCKHHILANSTFSWWGTALSKNKGIVIMPSRQNNLLKNNPLAFDNSVLINKNGIVIER